MRISDWSSDVCSSDLHRHRSALDHEVGGSRHAGSGNRAELHNCNTQPCYVAAIGQSVGKGMGARSLADVHNALAAAELSQGHAIAFAFFAERRVDAVEPSPPLTAPPSPFPSPRPIAAQTSRPKHRTG